MILKNPLQTRIITYLLELTVAIQKSFVTVLVFVLFCSSYFFIVNTKSIESKNLLHSYILKINIICLNNDQK